MVKKDGSILTLTKNFWEVALFWGTDTIQHKTAGSRIAVVCLMKQQFMGSEEKRERKVAFRYKPYRTGQRKTSVRKLESFDVVREQFESLAMPNQENVVQSSPKNVSPEVGDIS